jgi:hypothetical protein
LDKGSKNDASVDVGDPLVVDGKTATAASKKAEDHITSLEISRIRKSSERKARNGYCSPRIDVL